MRHAGPPSSHPPFWTALFWLCAACNGWQHESIARGETTGTFSLTVVDRSGRPVPEALVSLRDRQAHSDAEGVVRFPDLPEGGWLAQIAAPGFASETRPLVLGFASPGQRSAQIALEPAQASDVHLLFAGDLSFDGGLADPNRDGIVDDTVIPAGPGAAAGTAALLNEIRPFLDSFDLVTATLASVLGDGRTPHPAKADRVLAPAEVARGLADARIDVVNLATAHAYDFLDEGVRQTLAALDAAQVLRIGQGRDAAEASTPSLVERQGLRIGQVSLSQVTGRGAGRHGGDIVPTFEARSDKAGVTEATPAAVKAAVGGLLANPTVNSLPLADLVVAHVAAGGEWDPTPPDLAPMTGAAAAAGASLVLGNGPRAVGPLAITGSTLVATSLGQLVFGGQRPEARRAVLLETLVRHRRLVGARLRPVALVHHRPMLATRFRC